MTRALLFSLPLALTLACGSPQRPDGGRGMLAAGAPVPALQGVDQGGQRRSLEAERGRPFVVYFYPRDATPGCTAEACSFRDVWKRYEQAGIGVYGVSSDDAASHKKFADEQRLPFPLIADADGSWARAFGVSSTLGFYARVTFLVDRQGKVARVYPEVDPGVHAERVLTDAQALAP